MPVDDDTAARSLVFEDFSGKVGHIFVVKDEDVPSVALTLREAEPLDPKFAPPGVRPPFSLIFLAPGPQILPQRIYQMENDSLGSVAIFLVPVGGDAEGVHYQAVFN
ncbi:MAG TPA: hypothetical protein VMC05_14040 [Xanthobacteraceae bacterium]|nr:hypothetical protein [Xanthobacteraceae bacterium]